MVMMFCRTARQRLAPLALKTLFPSSNNAVPIRQMSFGLPTSGTNIAYMVLGGGSLTAALVYAYKTINSDSARYNDRIAQIEARSKNDEGAVVAFTEAAAAVEITAAALTVTAIDPISGILAEPNNAAPDSPKELLTDVTVDAEEAVATPAVVEAETPDAEKHADEVAADAAAPVAVTTAIPVSDLLSTARMISGSTAEISAASIGDQHLVAVRLDEEKHSENTFNGVELPDVKALVPEVEGSITVKAVDVETDMTRSDAVGEATTSDYDGTETNNPVQTEVTDEHPALFEVAPEVLSGETENYLALKKAVSSCVTLSDDDSLSGVADMTSATVKEDKAPCHETAGLEDFISPPALEKDLQATAGATEDVVYETMVDAV
ncbi:hypothetical protein E1301_Tti007055 [Triplophysa tibetana]|uniref:Protein MGARP N-terminal domain-containing protein n=1 Tax=Triplophysa tibetana TaxID=1572043 RepID=A0A5A9PNA6_9TELE|nr:hypothetical protein E1301_Tti007055 [Triplophysa tibetana]